MIDEKNWKGSGLSGGRLEKVTGAQPTFLPISFLETGLARAKSVCQVITPSGLATGFLTVKNLLITNHHVIGDTDVASRSQVRFNYQKTRTGCDEQSETYDLESAFASSST